MSAALHGAGTAPRAGGGRRAFVLCAVALAACSSPQRPRGEPASTERRADVAPTDAAGDADPRSDATGPDAAEPSAGSEPDDEPAETLCANGERPADPPPDEIAPPARDALVQLVDRVRTGGEAAGDRAVDRAFAARLSRAFSLYAPDAPAVRGAPRPLPLPTGFGAAVGRMAARCAPRWTDHDGRIQIQPALQGAPAANVRELDAVTRRFEAARGATAYCGGCPMLEIRYTLDRSGELRVLGWAELDGPPAIAPNQ